MTKFHYRLPPYPYYDMEGIEHWLSKMAEKGLFLDPEGYVFGLFQFQKDTPRKTKYRLEPIAGKSTVYASATEDPDPEALSFSEEFGWEYLGQFREFYVYRSFDPNARELNTDPVVQSMALDAVRRRSLFALLVILLLFTSWILGFLGNPNSLRFTMGQEELERFTRLSIVFVCMPIILMTFSKPPKGGKRTEQLRRVAVLVLLIYLNVVNYLTAKAATPVLDILNRGWLWWVLMAGCMLSTLLAQLVSFLHISRLQRQLSRGEQLHRGKPLLHGRILRILISLLPAVLLMALPFAASCSRQSREAISISDFT